MALIQCEECRKEISDTGDICIHCGYHLKQKVKQTPLKILVFPGIPLILIIFIILSTDNKWDYQFFNFVKEVTNQPVHIYEKEVQVQEDQYSYLIVRLEQTADITIDYFVKSGPNMMFTL